MMPHITITTDEDGSDQCEKSALCTTRDQRRDTSFSSQQYTVAKMRFVTSYLSVVMGLVLPMCIALYYAWLRNQRNLLNCMRRQVVPALFSISAGTIVLPSSKMEPILRAIKGRKEESMCKNTTPEKCVKCDVLVDPTPNQIRADVIFIHGLHGSLDKTWKQGQWDLRKVETVPMRRRKSEQTLSNFQQTHIARSLSSGDVQESAQRLEQRIIEEESSTEDLEKDYDEPYSKCWPRDWLPKDCPGVRVIALNYTTDPYLWRPLWITKRNRTSMSERGREMMDHLLNLGVGKNPIIWVGHSKGGLFAKQMMVDAWESGDENLEGIWRNTRGMMFYSVPHRGSPCADINLPLLRQSVELTEVQKDCREVLELHRKFLSLIENKKVQAEIFSFTETVQTFMTILHLQIVSTESGDPGIGELLGAPLDHRNICKPTSRQCFLYRELANLINRTV